jgi:hypothetical protein
VPVGLLLCEGVSQGPDVQLLSALIGDLRITVLPAGDKHGLANRVLARREVLATSASVAAICDSDFDVDLYSAGSPGDWVIRPNNQPIRIGWYWERVEVENYLVDPLVVVNAMKLGAHDAEVYREAFAAAAESLSDYTAARYALSRSRPRWVRLENRWGESAGLKDHPFPNQRDDTACRSGMLACLSQYAEHIPSEPTMLERYEQARIEYAPVGSRGKQPEIYYSGKDMLCALSPALSRLNFGSPGKFRERMLSRIESSPEPVWEWLPEWRELRRLLQSGVESDGL